MAKSSLLFFVLILSSLVRHSRETNRVNCVYRFGTFKTYDCTADNKNLPIAINMVERAFSRVTEFKMKDVEKL